MFEFEPKDPVKSVETSLQILETLSTLEQAGVSELADRLDHSKSTIHRHLSTLAEQGYVIPQCETYHIGLQTLELATGALNRQPLYPAGKSVVNDLVAETGESAAFAAEERGRAVYLYYNRTDKAVTTDAHIGIKLYLHCTGTGKAILAHLPPERAEAALDYHGLPEMTENTITDREELHAELEQIRQDGVAFDDEERLDGMRGVAVPVMDQESDALLGALTVAGPTRRLNGKVFHEEIPDLLKRAAKMLEVNITYSS